MTEKHRTSEYQHNSRLRRAQVKAQHRLGEPVPCWRGRGAIFPGQPFDVGHVNPHGGEGLGNLAPEHRHRVAGCCDGNRREGGRIGAQITNHRTRPDREVTTWAL
jgi:hypothetical protein